VPADWTDEFGGTGASACYVGGVATLMASHDPLLRPGELKRLITETATSLPPTTAQRSELHLVVPKAAAQAAIASADRRERESDSEKPARVD
jgi:subtilisin family serine protease